MSQTPPESTAAGVGRLVRETLPELARDYSYAFRYGAQGLAARLRGSEPGQGDGQTVLVITGIWEPVAFLHPLVDHLRTAGFDVRVSARPSLNLDDVTVIAERVCEHLDEEGLDDVVLVAHSKGGLVAKQVLLDEGPRGRVRGAVVLGTPWGGSTLATLLPDALTPVSALAPGSEMLEQLHEVDDANDRIVNIYPEHDPVVPSPESLRLAGAHNVQVGQFGHFAMLSEPDVLEVVADAVAWFADGCPVGTPVADLAPDVPAPAVPEGESVPSEPSPEEAPVLRATEDRPS